MEGILLHACISHHHQQSIIKDGHMEGTSMNHHQVRKCFAFKLSHHVERHLLIV